MRKAIFFIIILMVIVAIAVFTLQYQNQPKKMSFTECEEARGTVWQVNLNHPDICPTCAIYSKCYEKYNNYSDVCPICDKKQKECYEESLNKVCPYDNCRICKNKYFHDFKDDAEMFKLCPDCKYYEDCKNDYNEKLSECLKPCSVCKENNKKYEDTKEVYPNTESCMMCKNEHSSYPNKCPGGMKKIAEISDASLWFQCCK